MTTSVTRLKYSTPVELNPQNVQFEELVQWRTLEEDDNSWEPLKNLFEDVPELVKKLLTKLK